MTQTKLDTYYATMMRGEARFHWKWKWRSDTIQEEKERNTERERECVFTEFEQCSTASAVNFQERSIELSRTFTIRDSFHNPAKIKIEAQVTKQDTAYQNKGRT